MRQHASIYMKTKTIDKLKRLEKLDGEYTKSFLSGKDTGLCDLIEESFASKEKQLNYEYILHKKSIILIEGPYDD